MLSAAAFLAVVVKCRGAPVAVRAVIDSRQPTTADSRPKDQATNSSRTRLLPWPIEQWQTCKPAASIPFCKSSAASRRPPEFSQHAHIKSLAEYERLYKESIDDPDKFWSRIANELHWFKKWDKVLEWNCPWAKWFVGGQINLSYNCLDRHVQTARKNKAAIIWESEPGEVRTLTYQQLHREVQKFANVLKSSG